MDEFNFGSMAGESGASVAAQLPTYKMIALRGMVVFPGQTVHFEIGRDKSMAALERAASEREKIFLVAQKDKEVANPSEKDIYRVGVLARIQQIIKLPNDTARVLVTGLERMTIGEYVSYSPYFEVTLAPFEVKPDNADDIAAIKKAVMDQIEEFSGFDHKIPKENIALISSQDSEKAVAAAASSIFDSDADKQDLLETNSLYGQLEKIYARLVNLCEILAAEKRIAARVRESVDKNQKEYYLREQIKAIHAELGDDEEEIETFRQKAAEKNLPDYAVEKLEKELARMSKMAPTSPEAGVIRTYVEWMLDLPWSESTSDPIDLDKAEEVLDEDHYGLEKVKERIIE